MYVYADDCLSFRTFYSIGEFERHLFHLKNREVVDTIQEEAGAHAASCLICFERKPLLGTGLL